MTGRRLPNADVLEGPNRRETMRPERGRRFQQRLKDPNVRLSQLGTPGYGSYKDLFTVTQRFGWVNRCSARTGLGPTLRRSWQASTPTDRQFVLAVPWNVWAEHEQNPSSGPGTDPYETDGRLPR